MNILSTVFSLDELFYIPVFEHRLSLDGITETRRNNVLFRALNNLGLNFKIQKFEESSWHRAGHDLSLRILFANSHSAWH